MPQVKLKPAILTPDFLSRPTLQVAEELLGKFLVRQFGGIETSAMITEVEAYDGFDDRASHASRGQTSRNTPMFGDAGVWYVYLIYGMHEMLNVVTGHKGHPAAILIRGIEGVAGPGRVTKHFNITRALNNKPAVKETGLWIEDRGIIISKSKIQRTPRVGVQYAGEEWAGKLWRFVVDNRALPDILIKYKMYK